MDPGEQVLHQTLGAGDALGQSNPQPGQPQRSRPQLYAYHHADTSPTGIELEEFYSYTELPELMHCTHESFAKAWSKSFKDLQWTEATQDQQKHLILDTLEGLENRDAEQRFQAVRTLCYIVQGTPHETDSEEDHLQRILTNTMLLRACNTLQVVYDSLRAAGNRWAIVSDFAVPDESGSSPPRSPDWPKLEERQEFLEELNVEIGLYLNILYFMVEMSRGDEDWAEELMTLNPPLPVYLFDLIGGLREKNSKGYPVKKLLLLLWKTILSCCGGQKELSRVKALVREIEGLPADEPTKRGPVFAKVNATDFAAFRREISTKYPAFQPPELPLPIPQIPLESVAAAVAPLPLRPLYPYSASRAARSASISSQGGQGPGGMAPQPMPPTPAPSPPPSPAPINHMQQTNGQQQQQKPKKQQFQTDQTRPFILPFSDANPSTTFKRFVPRSILEAGHLYAQHVRISTELWQTVKLREECIADESGVAQFQQHQAPSATSSSSTRLPSSIHLQDLVRNSNIGEVPGGLKGLEQRLAGMSINTKDSSALEEEDEDDSLDPLAMLRKLRQEWTDRARNITDEKERKKEHVRIGDLQRLERIEIIYRAILPQMQPAVIVLLKLLLATITLHPEANLAAQAAENGDSLPQMSLEDTDVLRHREITSKAVSAILVLLLKWLKASHIMKFQYLAQLLVDSNCLLLILKIFGVQEVSVQIRLKHDVPDYNFFRYCFLTMSKVEPPGGRDQLILQGYSNPLLPSPARANIHLPLNTMDAPDAAPSSMESIDEEPEILHEYSARSFFTIINFVHVLQKLTKRKIHRILLLVQYKSSAVLKRVLKVPHPLLQYYLLKVLKSQIPYCGRKWRQSNMKVITAIYLNCRPDLKDDWLSGADVDGDAEDSLPHEEALRALIKFFNMKHYHRFAPSLHRRSSSHHSEGPGHHSQHPPSSPSSHPADESFPPHRSMLTFGNEPAVRQSYIPDSISDIYMTDEYEAILDDLLTPRYSVDAHGVPSLYPDSLEGRGGQLNSAWARLSELLGETDDISDSESVGSIGYLDLGSDSGFEENSQAGPSPPRWVEMSPEIIAALEEERDNSLHGPAGSPRSPRPRARRSSSEPKSPALRPVLTNIDTDETDDEGNFIDEEEMERGPAETAPHTGSPIDEVEAVFDE